MGFKKLLFLSKQRKQFDQFKFHKSECISRIQLLMGLIFIITVLGGLRNLTRRYARQKYLSTCTLVLLVSFITCSILLLTVQFTVLFRLFIFGKLKLLFLAYCWQYVQFNSLILQLFKNPELVFTVFPFYGST